jgi:hypothetical protein
MSFAHAFFILLIPRSDYSIDVLTKNDDPNNPWNIAPSYNQVFDNGTIDSNPFMIQPPNENTNMFIDYRTSLFAMYLFLIGNFLYIYTFSKFLRNYFLTNIYLSKR